MIPRAVTQPALGEPGSRRSSCAPCASTRTLGGSTSSRKKARTAVSNYALGHCAAVKNEDVMPHLQMNICLFLKYDVTVVDSSLANEGGSL
jgi:hypothetical protein